MSRAALAPAIGAKLRAMYGRRIRENQYQEMARKPAVSEVAAYLKSETWFGASLANMQENEIHRGQLELLLGRALFEEVQRLRLYDRDHFLFEQYLAYSEMQQVVSCIGFLQENRQNAFLENVPGYLIGALPLDWDRMVHAQTPEELVRALAHSRFGKIVQGLQQPDGTFPTLSICAAALQTAYYDAFLKLVDEKYSGREGKDLKELLMLQTSTNNLAVVYRLKRFFHVPPDQIQRRLVPYFSIVRKQEAEDLIAAPDVETFEKLLLSTRAGRWLTPQDFSYIEYAMARRRLKVCRQLFSFTTSTAAEFQCFLCMREIERGNVLRVVEGVRYGVPADEIMALIVREED